MTTTTGTDTATPEPTPRTIRRNHHSLINAIRLTTNRYTLHTGVGGDADVTPNAAWDALTSNPKARLQQITDGEHYRITVNATTWYDLRVERANPDLGPLNSESPSQRYTRAEMTVASVALPLMRAVIAAARSEADAEDPNRYVANAGPELVAALIAHGIATGEDGNPLTEHGWLLHRIWTEGSDIVRAEAEETRVECGTCGDPRVDTVVVRGRLRYATHRAANAHPQWCEASTALVRAGDDETADGDAEADTDVDLATADALAAFVAEVEGATDPEALWALRATAHSTPYGPMSWADIRWGGHTIGTWLDRADAPPAETPPEAAQRAITTAEELPARLRSELHDANPGPDVNDPNVFLDAMFATPETVADLVARGLASEHETVAAWSALPLHRLTRFGVLVHAVLIDGPDHVAQGANIEVQWHRDWDAHRAAAGPDHDPDRCEEWAACRTPYCYWPMCHLAPL